MIINNKVNVIASAHSFISSRCGSQCHNTSHVLQTILLATPQQLLNALDTVVVEMTDNKVVDTRTGHVLPIIPRLFNKAIDFVNTHLNTGTFGDGRFNQYSYSHFMQYSIAVYMIMGQPSVEDLTERKLDVELEELMTSKPSLVEDLHNSHVTLARLKARHANEIKHAEYDIKCKETAISFLPTRINEKANELLQHRDEKSAGEYDMSRELYVKLRTFANSHGVTVSDMLA